MEHVLIGAVVALIVGVYLRATLLRVTVFEFERGLKYRNGRFARMLGPDGIGSTDPA